MYLLIKINFKKIRFKIKFKLSCIDSPYLCRNGYLGQWMSNYIENLS